MQGPARKAPGQSPGPGSSTASTWRAIVPHLRGNVPSIINAFGAPIDETDAKIVAAYLETKYGPKSEQTLARHDSIALRSQATTVSG